MLDNANLKLLSGYKRVGVAVSDPLMLTAQGVEIIRRRSENKHIFNSHF